MKIYPSNHRIKMSTATHLDTDLNIPLAYINVDYTKYDIINNIHKNFSNYIKRPIIPGEVFDRPDIKLFNSLGEEINTDNLFSRQGDKYIYNPNNAIVFEPQSFLYKATIKKDVNYNISASYNIRLGCVDDPDSLDLSQRLANVFSNPSQRRLVPTNIAINSNRVSQDMFTNMTIKDADFIFIESPDGINYSEDDEIDFNSFLENNTNIWLGCEDHPIYKYENLGHKVEFKLKSPVINSNSIMLSDTYYNVSNLREQEGIIIHNLFEGNLAPILLLEYIGKGFLIISHKSIFDDTESYSNIMYEFLMYAYLNTYDSTPYVQEWITDQVPDYEVQNSNLVKKNNFVSSFDLGKYFGLKNSEMNLYNVEIKADSTRRVPVSNDDLINLTESICYIGMSNNKLIFEKYKNASRYSSEPEKPFGWKSIHIGDKIIYVEDLYYIVETSLNNKVYITESDVDLSIRILPFKSSLYAINNEMPTDLTIPFIMAKNELIERIREGTFTIYIKNNKIDFCYKEDFNDNGLELFDVTIKQTTDAIKIHDMRQLGGGLAEDAEDNFNLFDIGHINGRPYRKTGTLIIKMPKKYEKYKDKILNAVETFKCAEDYPVIFFENTEEEV